jgi:hypothetical protein
VKEQKYRKGNSSLVQLLHYLVTLYHVVRLCGMLLLEEKGARDVYVCLDLKGCTSS